MIVPQLENNQPSSFGCVVVLSAPLKLIASGLRDGWMMRADTSLPTNTDSQIYKNVIEIGMNVAAIL